MGKYKNILKSIPVIALGCFITAGLFQNCGGSPSSKVSEEQLASLGEESEAFALKDKVGQEFELVDLTFESSGAQFRFHFQSSRVQIYDEVLKTWKNVNVDFAQAVSGLENLKASARLDFDPATATNYVNNLLGQATVIGSDAVAAVVVPTVEQATTFHQHISSLNLVQFVLDPSAGPTPTPTPTPSPTPTPTVPTPIPTPVPTPTPMPSPNPMPTPTPSMERENSGFNVKLVKGGNTTSVDCQRILAPGSGNYYNTDTRTYRSGAYWKASSDNSSYQLKYSRRDAPNDNKADGGRCEVVPHKMLQGNGTFSARVYIHSNVAESEGVFTIAMMTADFNVDKEWDLFVANLKSNGQRVVKFGNPGKAASVSLSKLSQQWITISMEKTGSVCDLKVKTDTGSTLFSQSALPCNTGKGEGDVDGLNRIVINARAADKDGSDRYAFISISSVKWVKK